MRGTGNVPAVVYGPSGTMPLTVNEKELKVLLQERGHSAVLVDIDIEGTTTLLSDIADIQRDPITDRFLHIDFHEVSQTEKMTTVVPLEFFGESIGVKNSGGVIDIARHEVNIRCLPRDLPANIRVDISKMDVGSMIHLGDLPVPQNVELVGDMATPVISCKSPGTEAEQVASTQAAEGQKVEETVAKPEAAK
jgi:large subunit ribosomal protein L25